MTEQDRTAGKPSRVNGAAALPRSAPVETELKLLAPSGALDQLRTSPAILQSARNKGTVRRLETTYYDTNDHHLFDAGLSPAGSAQRQTFYANNQKLFGQWCVDTYGMGSASQDVGS